jgi:hypothetical protein
MKRKISIALLLGCALLLCATTITTSPSWKVKYDPDNNNPTYVGIASPGTSLATAGWKIAKFFYDGNNDVTDGPIWANGTDNFDKTWSLRATYTYTK